MLASHQSFLKPALQPVNLTGKMLGTSLQCNIAHQQWAAGNSAHTVFPELQLLIKQLPASMIWHSP